MKRWLLLYQITAGSSDAATGILLMVAPALTLELMHVTVLPAPIVFMRYIGIFVAAVGASYLWTIARYPLSRRFALAWSSQWQVTALIRLSIALFLLVESVFSDMEHAWLLIAAFDGLLAGVQIFGVWRGWFDRLD